MSFANAVIVLTSNLGSRALQKGAAGGAGLGFAAGRGNEAGYDMIKELVHEETAGRTGTVSLYAPSPPGAGGACKLSPPLESNARMS